MNILLTLCSIALCFQPQSDDRLLDATSKLRACPTLQELTPRGMAAKLGQDANAIYKFVRDEIGFEAYRGSLRGGEGALLSRSGNSYDQALLLKEMLDAMGFQTRLARASLPEDLVQKLISSIRPPEPDTNPILGNEDLQVLGIDSGKWDLAWKAYQQERTKALERVAAYAAADSKNLELPSSFEPRTPEAAWITDYLWVQIENKERWLDLHPCFPKDTKLQIVPEGIINYISSLPTELFHWVRLRLIAERVEGKQLSKIILLERRVLVAAATGRLVSVFLRPASTNEGMLQLRPAVRIGHTIIPGSPFKLPSSDGSITNGALTAIWLEIAALSPGERPRYHTISLVDKVEAGKRPSGNTTLAEVPLKRTIREMEYGIIAELLPVTGRFDFRLHLKQDTDLLSWYAKTTGGKGQAVESRLQGFPPYNPILLSWAALLEAAWVKADISNAVYLDAPAIACIIYRPVDNGEEIKLESFGGVISLRTVSVPPLDEIPPSLAGIVAARLFVEVSEIHNTASEEPYREPDIPKAYSKVKLEDFEKLDTAELEWSAESLEELRYDLVRGANVFVPEKWEHEMWWKTEQGTADVVGRGPKGWLIHMIPATFIPFGVSLLSGELERAVADSKGTKKQDKIFEGLRLFVTRHIYQPGASPLLPVLEAKDYLPESEK